MKFNRRFFFSLITVIIYGLLAKYHQKAAFSQDNLTVDSKNIPGIDTKPERPNIININPSQNIQFKYIFPVNFIDNQVPKQWLYKTPVKKGEGQKLVNSIINMSIEEQSIFKTFKKLPQELIISNSWPDFTDAIDLRKIRKDKQDIYSLFYTVITFDKPQLLRVCHGVAGFDVNAEMWVNNIPVKHGELIQVEKGIYSIIIEVSNNKRSLATRLTTVTKAEIEAVYQWQLSQWQTTIDMAKANDDQLLASVKFDARTIRGKEGFFQVGKSIHGKWWFIDPQGKAFYHRGCTGLNAGGMGGRRANLPPVPKKTVKTWINYLKEWGFNAMGSWTTSEFFGQEMAFTEIIETYYEKPWLIEKFPDVWDSQWAENVDQKCRKLCTPLKDNQMLLGYFLDNERGFMEMLRNHQSIIANAPTYRHSGLIEPEQLELAEEPKLNPKGIGLLQFCLSQNDDVPAAKKAWAFVLNRYDSLESLGKAWQIDIFSKQTIRDLTIREEILISETYLKDNYNFVKLWVEQYYRVCTNKIRKYDPNHLILGCRWGNTPGTAVLEVEKEWADVVSRNNYRANFYEIFDDFYQQIDRPILNGEVSTWSNHYSLVRNPIEPPGGYDAETRQKIRGREAMDRIFSHPGVLGYTKYRWHGPYVKLWHNNEPQFHVINPLRQANYRAVSIATFWHNSPAKYHEPLQGQIFITFLAGSVRVQELPPARIEDKASFKIIKNHLMIGLICDNNEWNSKVYGNGIKGEIVETKTYDNNYRLNIQIQTFPTLRTNSNVEAEYRLNLIRNQTKLEGTYTGIYDQHPVSGRAIAYVYRPVTTLRY